MKPGRPKTKSLNEKDAAMLIGNSNTAPGLNGNMNGHGSNAGSYVYDVTAENFEAQVIKASMKHPVLVDFWAPWCGPCKQLMPMLEEAVAKANGAVRLAKVNVDDNQDLAQALRVQSVPTVFAFFQGQPVTAFTGVRSQSELDHLMTQLSGLAKQGAPDAVDIPATLAQAAQALALGDIPSAQDHYARILAQDENNEAAYTGMIRCYLALPDLEQAQYMLDDAPETIAATPGFAAVRIAVEMAANAPQAGELEKMAKALASAPGDHQMRFDYATALFGAGQKKEAVDQLLEIIRRDRANEKKWEDDKARQHLLKLFEAMGPSDPETLAGRRKLSSLLFA